MSRDGAEHCEQDEKQCQDPSFLGRPNGRLKVGAHSRHLFTRPSKLRAEAVLSALHWTQEQSTNTNVTVMIYENESNRCNLRMLRERQRENSAKGYSPLPCFDQYLPRWVSLPWLFRAMVGFFRYNYERTSITREHHCVLREPRNQLTQGGEL